LLDDQRQSKHAANSSVGPEMRMTNSVTVIGEQTRINGSITGDEDLRVLGRVDGTINLKHSLLVESSGIVVADVDVADALVHGVLVGNIVASGAVQLAATARVVGDISAPRLVIAPGAAFRGNVDMGDLDAPVPKTKPTTGARGPTARGLSPASAAVEKSGSKGKLGPQVAQIRPTSNKDQPLDRSKARVVRPPTAAGRKARARRR
jgi:cytoskeletal protein CcmA (bactofilin family)